MTDMDLSDILFLDRHPAWTYRDLMETPELVVDGIRLLDREKAKASRAG